MARKRKRIESRPGELNLTAMIDIAFQLLNFFVITSHPMNVVAHLDVFRPSPEINPPKTAKPPPVIRVQIFEDGFLLNDRPVDMRKLVDVLTTMAGYDKKQTVLIQCSSQSTHGQLIDVLDLCAKVGLVNLSVVSSS